MVRSSDMQGSAIWRLLVDAHRSLGARFVWLMIVIPLCALVEGIGLALLFPLLAQLGMASSGPASVFVTQIQEVFGYLGLGGSFTSMLVVIAVVLQGQVVLSVIRGWLESSVQTSYPKILQDRIFHAVALSDWTFSVQEKHASQLATIITESTRAATALFMTVQVIAGCVLICVYMMLAIFGAWEIVVFFFVFGGTVYTILRPLSRKGTALGRDYSQQIERLQHAANEMLLNMKLIKSTGTNQLAIRLFAAATSAFRLAAMRTSFFPKLVTSGYLSFGYLLVCFGLWLSIDVLALAPAPVVISLYIFLRLYNQVSSLQGILQSLTITLPALPVVEELLGRARARAESIGQGNGAEAGGFSIGSPTRLEFNNVTVRYGERNALESVSASLTPGKIYGITGVSGSGKSTFVDCAVGLIKPNSGMVLANGEDLVRLNMHQWRSTIGYVGQETLLMRASIRDNISWGNEAATDEAIQRAARRANAAEFVEDLTNGYDTTVDDRGVNFSGGQRQRLGLARALLGPKSLLILDEATSALDVDSEAMVVAAAHNLRGAVTVLMVTHRLSSLSKVDEILVFEKGRLVQQGKHSELASSDGAFGRLLAAQAGLHADN